MPNPFIGHLSNCWRFNDSLDGVAGQPFLISSPTYEAAKFGNGLRMNGAVASAGPAIGSAAATGPFSWAGMCWFKPQALDFGSTLLNSHNGAFGGFELKNIDDGSLLFSILHLNGSASGVANPTILSLTEFNLILFGYNSITQKSFLRVNDVHADYPGTFVIPPGISANITLGARPLLTTAAIADGVINLLAFWYGRLLVPAEMQTLWNGGAGVDYPFA